MPLLPFLPFQEGRPISLKGSIASISVLMDVKCKTCGADLPFKDYGRLCKECGVPLTSDNCTDSRIKLRHYSCKECLKKSPQRQKHKERERRRRQEWNKHAFDVLGHVCAKCGCTDLRLLTIDHIYGGGNQERRRTKKQPNRLIWLLEPDEAKKIYQILCYNCQRIKAYERGEIGSGSIPDDMGVF